MAIGVPGIALAQADSPSGSTVLHVGGGLRNSQDTVLVEHLESRGHTVTRADDDALPPPSEIENYDLVWISSSVVPRTVRDAFADVQVPVISSEALLFDDLGIASRSSQASGQNGLRLADGTTIATTTARRSYAWGTAVPSATVIATLRSNPDRASVFTLGAGDALADGSPAPECRAGFFMDHASPSVLNDAGWALVDEVVDTMSLCGVPNTPPAVDPVTDRRDSEGDQVSFAVGASDADGDAVVLSVRGLPDGIAFDPATNIVSGELSAASASNENVVVTARDTRGAISIAVFRWIVDDDPELRPWVTNDDVAFISSKLDDVNDRPLVDRLRDRGFDVTVYDDNDLPTADVLEEAGLVWISSTVAPWRIGSKLTGLDVPIGTHEARLFDDLEIARSSGERSGQHSIRLSDGTAVRVSDRNRRVSWGIVGGDAEVLATQLTNRKRPTLFTYADGSELADGSTAAQCRAGFFAGPLMPAFLNDAGFDLFDQVTDTLHECAPLLPPNTTPVLDETSNQTSTARDVVSIQIGATDDDGHALTFEANGLPDDLTIDPATGIISGELGYQSFSNDAFDVTVTVTDERDAQDTQSFTWTIDPYVTVPTTTDRPNVLVVMTDDQTVEQMRWLPSLRAHMETGVEFTNSITNYPLCGPSRATFLTGLHAANHDLRCNPGLAARFADEQGDDSLAPWLQASGVHTIHVGKYLNGYGGEPAKRYTPAGWDDWRTLDGTSAYNYTRFRIVNNDTVEQYGFNGSVDYSTDVLTNHLDEALRATPASEPFFAVFTPLAPHYQGGQRYAIPAPRHVDTVSDVFRPDNFDTCGAARYECPVRGGDLNDQDPLTSADIAIIDDGYQTAAESLAAVDEAFVQILGTLGDLDRLDDTVIIFTSDNGFAFGEHGIQAGKRVPTRESLFVPLYITGPGFDDGSTVDAPVGNIDLAPTIIDLLGAPTDQPFDGQSLLDPLSDDRALFIEAKQQNGTVGYDGVYADGWLYIDWTDLTRNDLYGPDDPLQLETLDNDSEWDAVEADLGDLTEQLAACSGAACRIDWVTPPAGG